MTAAWIGPPIGVMRPGMLAVSGCRPPKGYDDGQRTSGGRRPEFVIADAIFTDVRRAIALTSPPTTIVHGGAKGVDEVASLAGYRRKLLGHAVEDEKHLPNYRDHGLSAPAIRNAYVTTTERFCAWPAPWSRGTWDAVRKRLRACGAQGFEMRMSERVIAPTDVLLLMERKGATWTEI